MNETVKLSLKQKVSNFFKKQKTSETLEITFGVLLLTCGFYFFFLPANLVTGGVLGLSIVFENIVESEEVISLFVTIANGILLVIGGLLLGKKFFFKTIYGSILLSTFLIIFEKGLKIPNTLIYSQLSGGTSLLVSALFGGCITGLGLGLVLRNNATTGGMDIVQRIVNKFLRIPFSLALYAVDGTIIIIGIIVTKSLEGGFFAIGALLLTGVVIDYVMLRGKSGYTVFIVTHKFEELKNAIYKEINRGITKTSVVGGYSLTEKDMIICTITKNQLYDLKYIIQENDPDAFTFIMKANETLGSGFRQVND